MEGGTGVRAHPSHSPSLPPGSFQAGEGRSDPRLPSPIPFILLAAGILLSLRHRGGCCVLGINRGCGHSWWVLFGFILGWVFFAKSKSGLLKQALLEHSNSIWEDRSLEQTLGWKMSFLLLVGERLGTRS